MRTGGPFVISCGEHNNKYLHIVEINHKKQVIGVEGREKASLFYIFTKENPKVFNIAYFGRKENDRYTESGLYLMTNTRFGHDSGPLEVGGASATNFIFHHPSKDDDSLSIELWETDGFYVRLAPRKFQIKSYMAFDEENYKTVCVRDLAHDGKNNVWLRFQLRRVRYESSTCITAYGFSHDSAKKASKEEPSPERLKQTEANNEFVQPLDKSSAETEEQEVRGSIHYRSDDDEDSSEDA